MSQKQTPVWLDDDSHLEDIQPLRPPIEQLQPTTQQPVPADLQKKILIIGWALRITTMLLCVLMVVTSIIGLGN